MRFEHASNIAHTEGLIAGTDGTAGLVLVVAGCVARG
jgi:hypothetical protein